MNIIRKITKYSELRDEERLHAKNFGTQLNKYLEENS